MIRRISRNENNRNYRFMKESFLYEDDETTLLLYHTPGHPAVGAIVSRKGIFFDGKNAHFECINEDNSITVEEVPIKDIDYIGNYSGRYTVYDLKSDYSHIIDDDD